MNKSPVTRCAVIFVGAASFYGNSATEEGAIQIAFSELKRAESRLGKLRKDARIPVHVFDFEPYDKIRWQDCRVYGMRSDGTETLLDPLKTVALDYKGKNISA